MKTTIQTKHIRDIWGFYATQILAAHKDWWGRFHHKIKNYYIYRKIKIDGKPSVELVFSYAKFKEIIDEVFIAAKDAVIQGEAFNLLNHVGKVCARRVERNHKNRMINWGKTKKQEKVWSEKSQKFVPKRIIYYTDDDWCRIGLHKTGRLRNETVYTFVPTENNKTNTGFKQQFTQALQQNILLKYRYLYYPLQNHAAKEEEELTEENVLT